MFFYTKGTTIFNSSHLYAPMRCHNGVYLQIFTQNILMHEKTYEQLLFRDLNRFIETGSLNWFSEMKQTYRLFFCWSLKESLSFSFICSCITIYSDKQRCFRTDIFTKHFNTWKKSFEFWKHFELIHWNCFTEMTQIYQLFCWRFWIDSLKTDSLNWDRLFFCWSLNERLCSLIFIYMHRITKYIRKQHYLMICILNILVH